MSYAAVSYLLSQLSLSELSLSQLSIISALSISALSISALSYLSSLLSQLSRISTQSGIICSQWLDAGSDEAMAVCRYSMERVCGYAAKPYVWLRRQ